VNKAIDYRLPIDNSTLERGSTTLL